MNRNNGLGRLFGFFLLLYSLLLLFPAAVSVWVAKGSAFAKDSEVWGFLIPMCIVLVAGLFLRFFSRPSQGPVRITARSGFLIVTAFWALAAGIGALPFLLTMEDISITDAYFESMSGFTTTGATILRDVESLKPGLGLWRCMIQWVGGMGIIILFVAVLPTYGGGGLNLFRAEIPGGTMVERIKPRIAETAKSLWKVYLLLSFMEFVFLQSAGMPLYDALCHTFTTMPTGGFSIKNQGIAAYDNYFIEVIITIFMFIAGANFALHYSLLHGENRYMQNAEFKAYLGIFIVASLIIFISLLVHNHETPTGLMLRQTVFQVVSIGTTTGFATTDYNQWPVASQLVLLILMFVGGCTGSTGGSMKVLRHMIAVKAAFRNLYLSANPKDILPLKTGDKIINTETVLDIFSFALFFIGMFILGAFCLAVTDMDMTSAFGGAAAAIGNIGPGFGSVGPASTFAPLSSFAKWVLVVLMLLGRLELYTVLVLVAPLLRKK